MTDFTDLVLGLSAAGNHIPTQQDAAREAHAAAQSPPSTLWNQWMSNTILSPPLPPGIHWEQTGGKTWRVEIVRAR